MPVKGWFTQNLGTQIKGRKLKGPACHSFMYEASSYRQQVLLRPLLRKRPTLRAALLAEAGEPVAAYNPPALGHDGIWQRGERCLVWSNSAQRWCNLASLSTQRLACLLIQTWHIYIHPRKLTWIPKMMVWERRFLLNIAIFGIYVRFLGVIYILCFQIIGVWRFDVGWPMILPSVCLSSWYHHVYINVYYTIYIIMEYWHYSECI